MPAIPALHLAESAESQDRTGDTAIFSRVLYQLSYLGPKRWQHLPTPAYFTQVSQACQSLDWAIRSFFWYNLLQQSSQTFGAG
jgi:hypothetical protein